jgi:hypothetical protein
MKTPSCLPQTGRLTVAVGLLAAASWILGPRLNAQTLAEALDSPAGWTWVTSATDGFSNPFPGGVWTGQSATTHDGVDAARSGPLPAFGTSRLRTESFVGPGTVTFWRRHGLSPEQNSSSILANGSFVGPFLPGGVWQPVAVDFPPGPASLEFVWFNTGVSGSATDNALYIDEVAFQPTTGAPQFVANPLPALTVGEGYTLMPPVAVRGEKPMAFSIAGPGGTPSFNLQLDPPATNQPPRFSGSPSGYVAAPDLTGMWTVTASNALGSVTQTFTVTVTPAAPHSIYVEGPSAVWAGASITLSAGPRGTAPFTYEWLKDGTPIAGQTNATLALSNFSAADVADYSVRVSNGLGTALSSSFRVELGTEPPEIISQSGNQDVPLFGGISLNVQVSGTAPLDTEWRKDGALLDRQTGLSFGSSFYFVGGFEDSPGVYGFTVTNGLGSATATNIVVQVGQGIDLANALENTSVGWRFEQIEPSGWVRQTAQSHDGTDAAALENQPPTPLRTAVEGPAAVHFWWRVVDGTLDFSVDGSVEETITTAAFGDSGWQSIQLNLGTGWHELEWRTRDLGHQRTDAYLDEVSITPGLSALRILAQPQGGDFAAGDTASLSVTVRGTGPFDYRLFRDASATPAQTALGETSQTNEFTVPLSLGSEGSYWIEVTDATGATGASDDAVISIDGSFATPTHVGSSVGQPLEFWSYSRFSALDGDDYPISPWYRTRQDGVAPGTNSSIRTPVLNSGQMAAVVMSYQADVVGPARLRFSLRVEGAPAEDVFGLSINGTLVTPTFVATTTGASGQSWRTYDVVFSDFQPDIQWEILADSDGITAWLDQIELLPATLPVITAQPLNLVLPAGESGGLSVAASSPVPVSYQWFRTGTGALANQTNDTLTFTPLSSSDNGQYYVRVSNAFGDVESDRVGVFASGPRPLITQPLQPRQLAPGAVLELEVVASSGNGSLSYEWFRDGQRIQFGGATYTFVGVNPAQAGLYRVVVSDPYYSVTSEARVTVSQLFYTLTWLPSAFAGGNATASAINNAGVVAGHSSPPSGFSSATVWTNAVPLALTPPNSEFSWARGINNAGDIAGVVFRGGVATNANLIVRWSPPYSTNLAVLGFPAGQPNAEEVRINDRGDVIGGFLVPGNRRFTYRYTPAGIWESPGALTGATPPPGNTDDGSAAALDANAAGVIVGNTGFQGGSEFATNFTGWLFDPAVAPPQRTAMEALNPLLAPSPTQPLGWLDAVNDLGDIAGRRWGRPQPTTLYLIPSGGSPLRLLETVGVGSGFLGESFNVDAMNNRRELVGHYFTNDLQRAALVRDRDLAPGATPTVFTNFALLDLNDLVLGGVPGFRLTFAHDINDAGQIIGSAVRDDGTGSFAFLLTPVTPYAGMAAQAVDDVLIRRTGQTLRFSAAGLIRNDLGGPPLTVSALAATSASGGTLTDLGGGWHRYTPPAGSEAADSFTYTVRAADGSTATGTAHVLVESEAPPSGSNQLPLQIQPGGQVRVRFVGIPGRTYQIESAPAMNGPWTSVASLVAGSTGVFEFIDTPPNGVSRFYRAR